MKKLRPLGLLASGPVSRTGIVRLTSVQQRLGPVKAPSYRVARRMVNSWRAGYAVRDYRDLEDCDVLIVDVPPQEYALLMSELAKEQWDWSMRTILLWSPEYDSSVLSELAARGAQTASLFPVPGIEKRLAAEGSRPALREIKRLMAVGGWRVMELEPGGKPLYHAGLNFADVLSLPLMHAAVQSLMEAGLSYAEAVDVGVAQMQRAVRSYVNTGRRAWPGSQIEDSVVPAQLARQRPALASLYRACLHHGHAVFQQPESGP